VASAGVLARVRAIAPEFADLTDGEINVWADYVLPYINTVVYPAVKYITGTHSFYDEAQSLWTAHLLTRMPTTEGGGGGGGSAILVTSDKTGDLQQSYAFPSGIVLGLSDMDLLTTHYGVQLIRLRATRPKATIPRVF